MDQKEAERILSTAIRARTPIIAIKSPEENRVLEAIRRIADRPTTNVKGDVLVERRLLFHWTVTEGLVMVSEPPDSLEFPLPDYAPEATAKPSVALFEYCDWVSGETVDPDPNDPGKRNRAIKERASLLVMLDMHPFIESAMEGGQPDVSTKRALRDAFGILRKTQSCLILVSPNFTSLGDADRDVFQMSWPLPSITELSELVESAASRVEDRVPVDLNGGTEVLARALAALTMNEAARTLSMAIVETEALSVAACADLILSIKSDILRKRQGLQLIMPEETLNDVAGLDLLKVEMRGLPKLLTQEAKRMKVRPPRGILLAGPPGTGKTLSAKVMGAAANLPVLMWSIGETHSKYVGDSAHNTRAVLDAADAINNCILVVDEGDTQLSEGGEGDSKAHDEVLGMVLTWMQEKTSDVVVVLTTNHPERMRHALLERCDRQWFVDYPTLDACEDIIRIHLRKRDLSDVLTEEQIGNLAMMAHSKTLAGRNIEFAIETAHSASFMEGRRITYEDLRAKLEATRGLMEKRPDEATAIRQWCKAECQPATSEPDQAGRPRPAAQIAKMDDALLEI